MSTDAEGRPFFYGRSAHRLNAKGQVALPKRFRDILPGGEGEKGFVLLRGEGACLYMYTHAQFGEVKANARRIALEANDPEFYRMFLEDAHPIDLDSQGRFVLPGALREAAGIGGPEVLFLGVDDRIELWSPERRAEAAEEAERFEERRRAEARAIFGF